MNISMIFRHALPALLRKNGKASFPFSGQTGAPLIPGALASFECENYARYDGGDHLILVGKVCALTTATAGDVRPLIFYIGSYQKIERDYDPNTPSDFYYLLNGW